MAYTAVISAIRGLVQILLLLLLLLLLLAAAAAAAAAGWLTTLAVGWAHITPEDVHTSAKLAMAELLLSGCTTTSDMLYLYPNGVKLDDEIAAARELGMRFQPSRGTVTKGKSAGGIFDDGVCEKEEEVLAEFKRLIATFHDPRPHAMLRIALAPCSPFTCSDDFFVKTAELARAHEVRSLRVAARVVWAAAKQS